MTIIKMRAPGMTYVEDAVVHLGLVVQHAHGGTVFPLLTATLFLSFL
jgi:hypothetical protein